MLSWLKNINTDHQKSPIAIDKSDWESAIRDCLVKAAGLGLITKYK
jgi:hypothetical protein